MNIARRTVCLRSSTLYIPSPFTARIFCLPPALRIQSYHSANSNMATNGQAPALKRQRVEKEAEHISNGEVAVNNWSSPGPAAFDFRSVSSCLH